MMVSVYVLSGDLNQEIERPFFPHSDQQLVEIFKEALEQSGETELGFGILTCFSPTPKGYSQKALFIATESLIEKAGFEIRKKGRHRNVVS